MKRAVVVTGDSGALGSAICRAISGSLDVDVIGMSRRTSAVTQALQVDLEGRYKHVTCDLAQLGALEETFRREVYDDHIVVGLVNNSAFAYDDLATNLQVDPLHEMFTVNVYAPMLLSKLVIRNMLLNETSGSLVHISSISVHTGYKGLSMYAATKGALEAYSLNLAREWGSRGVRSNCVAAGFMDTPMTSALTEEQKERILKRNSMRSMLDVEEVADAVAFLLSEKSSGLTGATLRVDHGTI